MLIGGEKHIEKEFPSEQELLDNVSDYDIFRHYIEGDFRVGDVMSSPLRKDETPSFSIYKSKRHGSPLFFKDFGSGEFGGAIRFVQQLFGLNYREAIDRVILDFRVDDKYLVSCNAGKRSERKPISYDKAEALKNALKIVRYTSRKFTRLDKEYWGDRYGIPRKLLEAYGVVPIKYFFINDTVIKAEKYAYAFTEYKDNFKRNKIYQPFSEQFKWISGYTEGTLSGFSQLPIKGDLLFIASSLKDGLVLKTLGYDFIAPQTEGYIFKENILLGLKKRFKHIVTFFDDDNAGHLASERLLEQCSLPYILTNDECKDISDFRECHGAEVTNELINERLYGVFNKE